ncbi:MAG: aminoacyl-tRNA hydrolase, partial [Maritimibacter sp.]|nr:aminoacyl-tRNA hydrolase [Maritimibacter sp.]
MKLKQGGGHAGHNGLRSIHQHIGESYDRVRLGIGHPGHKDRVSGYVLSDFAKAEEGWLDDLLRGIEDGAPFLAAGNGAKFSNAVALRAAPAKPKPAPKPKPDGAAPPGQAEEVAVAAEEVRSPLQKLVDKFR